MKLTILTAVLSATMIFAQSAQAREHHHRYGAYHAARGYRHVHRYGAYRAAWRYRHAHRYGRYQARHHLLARYDWSPRRHWATRGYALRTQHVSRGRLGGRPAAWCGWQMRQMVGRDPGVEYNLARNWARWGHSGPAGVGAVVVWPHHVGKIVGRTNGMWLVESGNDGNRLRTRPRSISGAIAIRWG